MNGNSDILNVACTLINTISTFVMAFVAVLIYSH